MVQMDRRSNSWRRARLDPGAPTGSASVYSSVDGNGDDDKNGAGPSQSDTSSSSGLPTGCSVSNIRPVVQGCTFLDDNDGSLHYSEGWNFSTSDPNGLLHTLHFTETLGSSVSLSFNASSAIVFGLVPSGSSPPQASYSIDSAPPTSPHMAATSACVPNQQLFNSGNLDAGFHNLTIEVTTASRDQPYILDFLLLCEGSATTSSNSTTTSTDTLATSSKDMIIMGVVLAAVILFLVIALCVLLSRIRWKSQEQETADEKQKVGRDASEGQGAVAPFSLPTLPQEPQAIPRSVTQDATLVEEDIALSEVSNAAARSLASAVENDGLSSSLAPPPSTATTVLARRLDKATRFRSPLPFWRAAPTQRRSMGGNEVRVNDEQPPPYALN